MLIISFLLSLFGTKILLFSQKSKYLYKKVDFLVYFLPCFATSALMRAKAAKQTINNYSTTSPSMLKVLPFLRMNICPLWMNFSPSLILASDVFSRPVAVP